jgi:hypothetical protein
VGLNSVSIERFGVQPLISHHEKVEVADDALSKVG